MIQEIRKNLLSQFGAAIDMLENAVGCCPDFLWTSKPRFYYLAFHTTLLLDYYLSVPPPEEFVAELPFSVREREDIPAEAPGDMIPDRIYTKEELLNYISNCRRKCETLIPGLDENTIVDRWVEAGGEMDYSVFEILLYNMRHVQHHAGQLNMILREEVNASTGWVFRGGEK